MNGRTESQYLRLLICQRPDDYPEIQLQLGHLINEVNHVGVNINQIVKRNHAGFFCFDCDFKNTKNIKCY